MKKDRRNQKSPKSLLTFLCIIIVICLAWVIFALYGRVPANSAIPEQQSLRLSVHNPVRLLDGILSHETVSEIDSSAVLAPALPFINFLQNNTIFKNRLIRLMMRGNLEAALLSGGASIGGEPFIAAWDMGLFSPLLRLLPIASRFAAIPGLYYVQAGKNSRFEYRMDGLTMFIGPYRNLLIITDSPSVFESRESIGQTKNVKGSIYQFIRPSSYDAAFILSPSFLGSQFAEQEPAIKAVLGNIEFKGSIEAGLSILANKLELRITGPLSSNQAPFDRLIERRSQAPGIAERLPASVMYSTILSAGNLEELYAAAMVFSAPALDESYKRADSSSRALLGMSLNDLLFSWSGDEFAVFGMEGRPNPVYVIQVSDEQKRQDIFNRAFRTIALNENVRINIDGMRMPRIEIPDFLQALLRRWNLYLPSPYYTIYNGYLFASESAETLLAALRQMQRNEVLPRTATWRDIAGGRAASSAFSLYYSLDLSVPFFIRGNTTLSSFFRLYRQGLLRLSFNRGQAELNLTLIPGYGSGVTIVNGYPIAFDTIPSNKIYSSVRGKESRIFFSAGDSVISINPADNAISRFTGQGQLWVIPAEGMESKNEAAAWVVSSIGRVTLVNGDMEAVQGFPVLTGLRLSCAPSAFAGKVYLCDEDGKVHTVDENGNINTWGISFASALRSPPSFLAAPSKAKPGAYAAVYPKSFFGEIWLLDSDGNALPNWPVELSLLNDEMTNMSSGIGFGSPLLFAHNNQMYTAFITQAGELFIFDENAVLFQGFPLTLDGVFYLQPVFDNEYLWLASANGTLFQVSLTGDILSQNIPGFRVMEEGHIMLFDCDGDKIPEVFITGEGNALHAYSRNFRSIKGFPLPVWGKPLFVNFGSSGKGEFPAEPRGRGSPPECFGMGMDGKLYRWRFK